MTIFQYYLDIIGSEFGTSNVYYFVPLLFISSGLFIVWLCRPKLRLPPGPIGLPLVGYLPFLGKEPFRTLDNLKKKYGNVISLYMGRTYMIILGDYPAVEEAFSKSATLDRPPGIFDFLPDGFGFGGVNGEEWATQRRFFLRTIRDLGLGKSTWATLVEDEVSDFLKHIASKKGQPLDINKPLTASIASSIASIAFGKRLQGQQLDSLNSSLDTVMRFFASSSLWNYYPWLCKILTKLKIGNYHNIHKEMVFFNSIMKNEVEDHKKFQDDSQGFDYISQCLEAMQSKENKGKQTTFNERNMLGGTQVLFAGGSDTTKMSLSWLFLAMAAFPEVQKKVQAELESVSDEQTMALWEERIKFPYTYSVIMECQRWRPIVPLNTLRMASENLKVCGYDIPKGATIVANYWGVHNDPRYWPEPEKFIPERFLRNGGKEVNLKPESYVPFSFGKRKCPGETFALMEIFIYFTATMKRFDVQVPEGRTLNLDGVLGLTYQPVPQKLCFVQRR